jgi:hypothetical protein
MNDFNINVRQLKASEGSHMPLLIRVLYASDGPVLELGTGLNSTPLIHWICNEMGRKVDSYESHDGFYLAARNYRNDWHGVHLIKDWDTLAIDQHWGVVFIDHAPGPRRNVEMGRLCNNADYVVVHDTEPKSDWHYHYSNHFDKYKYRYDYTLAYPQTSVFSNFKDLSAICASAKE